MPIPFFPIAMFAAGKAISEQLTITSKEEALAQQEQLMRLRANQEMQAREYKLEKVLGTQTALAAVSGFEVSSFANIQMHSMNQAAQDIRTIRLNERLQTQALNQNIENLENSRLFVASSNLFDLARLYSGWPTTKKTDKFGEE